MIKNFSNPKDLFLGSASVFLFLATIVLIIAGIRMIAPKAPTYDQERTITVQGEGEVEAVPDVATIYGTYSSEGEDLATVQLEVEKGVSKVVAQLEGLGIDESDIETTSYSAYPRYDYNQSCTVYGCESGERELLGYEVSQTLKVKVRDLSLAGKAVGFVGESGATGISGPTFEVDDLSAFEEEARKEAIKNAKESAKKLANELGGRLGKLVSFQEGDYYGRPVAYMDSDMAFAGEESVKAVADITIPEGSQTITKTVTLVYRLK